MGYTVPFKVMLKKKNNKITKAFPLGSTSYWVPPPPPSTILATSSEPVSFQKHPSKPQQRATLSPVCEAMTTVCAPSDGAAALHVQLNNPVDEHPGGKGQSF